MAEEGTAVVEESPSGFVFPTGEIPTEIQSVGPEGEESPDDWGDVEGVGPEFVEEENKFTTSDDTETKPSDYFKYVPPEEGGFGTDNQFLGDQFKLDTFDYESYEVDTTGFEQEVELSAEEKIEAEKNHEYILQNPDLAKLLQTRKPETGEDILAILADETIPWETRAKLDLLISGRREESEQILAKDSIEGSLARTGANLKQRSTVFTSGITTNVMKAISFKEGFSRKLSGGYSVITTKDAESNFEDSSLSLVNDQLASEKYNWKNQLKGSHSHWLTKTLTLDPLARDFDAGLSQKPFLTEEGEPVYLTQAALGKRLGLDEYDTSSYFMRRNEWPIALEFTNEVTGEDVLIGPVTPGALHNQSEHVKIHRYFNKTDKGWELKKEYRGLKVKYHKDGRLASVLYNGREYLTADQQSLFGVDIKDPFGLTDQLRAIPSLDNTQWGAKIYEEFLPGLAPHLTSAIATAVILRRAGAGKLVSLPGVTRGTALKKLGAQNFRKGLYTSGMSQYLKGAGLKGVTEMGGANALVEALSYDQTNGNMTDLVIKTWPQLENSVFGIFQSNELDSNRTAFVKNFFTSEVIMAPVGIPFEFLGDGYNAAKGINLKTQIGNLGASAFQFDANALKLNLLTNFKKSIKAGEIWFHGPDQPKGDKSHLRQPGRSGATDWGPGGKYSQWIKNKKLTGEIRKPDWETGYTEQQIIDLDSKPDPSFNFNTDDLLDFNISSEKELDTSIKATEENLKKLSNDVEASVRQLNETINRLNETSTPLQREVDEEFGVDESLSKPLPGEISDVSIDEISTAPEYFQVKESGVGEAEGVSGSLKGAKAFDPELAGVITLWRDTDGTIGDPGKVYIVDGHNRLDLAKRSGQSNILSRFINVRTWQEARARAALINIAGTQSLKGSMQSVDVAKFLRNDNYTLDDLAAKGINLQNSLVAEAVRLNRLPDDLFGKVSTGELSLAKALALGSAEGVSPEAVMDIYKLAVKQRWSIGRIEQAVMMARNATVGIEEGVFPELSAYFKQSNIKQLLTVRTEVVKQLRARIRALAPATRAEQAELLEGIEGNIINIKGSRQQRQATQAVLNVFNRVAGLDGPVTNLLTDIATNLKGNNASRLVKERLADIEEAIMQEAETPGTAPRSSYNEAVTKQIEDTAVKVEDFTEKVDRKRKPRKKPKVSSKVKDETKFKEVIPEKSEDSALTQLDRDGAISSDPRKIDSTPPSTSITKTTVRPELIDAIKENPKAWLGEEDIWGEIPVKDQVVEIDAEEVPINEIQKLLTERPNEIPIEDLAPAVTALAKADPKTPLDIFIRSAPDSQQASIAFNRLIDSFEKFSDGFDERTPGLGPINTVGDFINLLNIGRVAIEEGTQKALRDIKKADRFGRLAAPYVQKAGKAFLKKAIEDIERVQIYTKALQLELGGIYKDVEKRVIAAGKEADKELANIDNWEDSKILKKVFERFGLKEEALKLEPIQNPTFADSSMGKNWAGKSAPTYSKMKLTWESDVDKAIYIATSPNKSTAKDKFWYWLEAELGIPRDQIIDTGILLRNEMKENYEAGTTWKVEDTETWGFGGNTEMMTFDIEDARLKELLEKIDEDLLRKYLDITDPKDPGDLLAKFKERFEEDYLDLFPTKGYGDKTINSSFAGPLANLKAQEELIRTARRIFPAGKIEFPFEVLGKVGKRQAAAHPNLKGKEGKWIRLRGAYSADPRGAAYDIIRVAQFYGGIPASFSEKMFTVIHEATHAVFRRFYTKADAELLLTGEKHLREIAAIAAPHKAEAIRNGSEGFGEVISYAAMIWDKVKGQYLLPGKDVTWAQPLQKLGQLVDTVKRWLGRKGYETWDELFEATVSGEFAATRKVAGAGSLKIGDERYYFGAFNKKVQDIDFLPALEPIDPDDFKARVNVLKAQMEKGSTTLYELMMSEQRRLISRGKNAKGSYDSKIPGKRLYLPLSEEGIILSSKVVEDQIYELIGDRAQRTGIPSNKNAKLIHAAKELLIANEMATEKILNLWEEARAGDITSDKDLVTTVAIGILRDQNQLGLKEVAVELKLLGDGEIPLEKKAELGAQLNALWLNQLVLNRVWEQITRKWGQLGQATQLDFDTQPLTLQANTPLNKYVSDELVEEAMTKGLQVEKGIFGEGVYFTTNTDGSLGTVIKGQLPVDIAILDLIQTNKRLEDILAEIGVDPSVDTVNGKKVLSQAQALAIQDYALKNGYDGVRFPTDLSQEAVGDFVVFFDTNAANRAIGSQAAVPPQKGARVEGEVDGETEFKGFVNDAIRQAAELLESKLEPEIIDAINKGELTIRAEEALDELAEMAYQANSLPKKDAKLYMRDATDLLSHMPDGTGWQRTIADIRRSALFLNMSTWGKVVLGGSFRLLTMPMTRKLGNWHMQRLAKKRGNYFEAESANIRGQIDSKLYAFMIAEISNALRLSNEAWMAGETLVNPGRQHYQDAKIREYEGVDLLGNKISEEQFNQGGKNRALQKRRKKGPQWFEKPTANPIALAVRHLDKFAPTHFLFQAGARRGLSAVDTFLNAITGPVTERARLLEMEIHKIRAKGKTPTEKDFNLIVEKVNQQMKDTWVDMIVDGRLIEDAYLDSSYAQNWMDYVNMTDKLQVDPQQRTWQYGLKKAQEEGIENVSEQLRFAEDYAKTTLDAENFYQGKGFNHEVNIGFKLARQGITLLPRKIASLEQEFPITGAVIPTNRTQLNLFKATIRYTGQGQHLIDTAWRDINHEDPNIVANALGEYGVGAALLSAGILAAWSGHVEFTGAMPTDYRERKKWEMVRKQPWSVRIKLPFVGWGPYVNISFFDAAAPILGLVGSYMSYLEKIPSEQLTEDNDDLTTLMAVHLAAARAAIVESTVGQISRSSLKALHDLLELATDFEDTLTAGSRADITGQRNPAGYWLEQLLVGGATPQVIQQMKTSVDPTMRQINESNLPGPLATVANTINGICAKMPYCSLTQPQVLHQITGEPIVIDGHLGSGLSQHLWDPFKMINGVFNPLVSFKIRNKSTDIVDEEMARLQGQGATFLIWDRRILGVKNVVLNTKQLNELITIGTQEVRNEDGLTLHEELSRIISTSDEYKALPKMGLGRDEETGEMKERANIHHASKRVNYLYKTIKYYKSRAKEIFLERNPELQELVDLKKKRQDEQNMNSDNLGPQSNLEAWRSLVS